MTTIARTDQGAALAVVLRQDKRRSWTCMGLQCRNVVVSRQPRRTQAAHVRNLLEHRGAECCFPEGDAVRETLQLTTAGSALGQL